MLILAKKKNFLLIKQDICLNFLRIKFEYSYFNIFILPSLFYNNLIVFKTI